MASTSSVGAQAATSASTAQEFYSTFNTTLQDLTTEITSANQIQDLEALVQKLSKARNQLTEITSQLPTYDRNLHEQNFKTVSNLLSKKRSELEPNKIGFSFKKSTKLKKTNQEIETSKEESLNGSKISNDFQKESTIETSSTTSSSFLSLADRNQEFLNLDSISFPEKNSKRDGKEEEEEASDLHLRNLNGCLIDLRTFLFSEGQSNSQEEKTSENKKSGNGNGNGHGNVNRRFKALQIRNLKNCLILAGEIKGSVMIHDCQDSIFLLGCQQFRMHNSSSSLILIKTFSLATIEDCTNLILSSISSSILHHSSTDDDDDDKELISEKVSSDTTTFQVQDFNHISDSKPSPNWKLLDLNRKDRLLRFLKKSSIEVDAKNWEEKNEEIVERFLNVAGISS